MSIRPSTGLVRLCFQLLSGFEAISRGRIPDGCKILYPMIDRGHAHLQIAHWLRLNGLPEEAVRFEATIEDSFRSIVTFGRRLGRPPRPTEAANDAVNLLRPLADMLVGSAQAGIAEHSLRVELRDREEGPIVLGKAKQKLTKAQYNVVKTALGAPDGGWTKDQLVTQSGHGDALQILRRLAGKDQDWAQVIHLAGQTGGGYWIK